MDTSTRASIMQETRRPMPQPAASDQEWAELLAQQQPMVRAIARELSACLPVAIDRQDLEQVGNMAVVTAAQRYTPGRGASFATYASAYVRGEMLQEIHRLGGVPRSVRDKINALQSAYTILERAMQHPPSNEALAHALSVTMEDLEAILLLASSVGTLSLDEILARDADPEGRAVAPRTQASLQDPSAPDPIQALFSAQVRQALDQALLSLPAREQTIVQLYYTESCTWDEIGEVLGMGEHTVRRLHARAILHLRARLERVVKVLHI